VKGEMINAGLGFRNGQEEALQENQGRRN